MKQDNQALEELFGDFRRKYGLRSILQGMGARWPSEEEVSGFDPERIYEIEGNWLTMQCSHACHDTLYPSLDLAERMAADGQETQQLSVQDAEVEL